MDNFERTKPLVSIIIPSWFTNSQDGKYGKHETFWFASECIEKLNNRTSTDKYELIMIDNGSTLREEETHEMPLSINDYWNFADILIRNRNNLGFAGACNQGFNVARGEYICCLNNDVIVYPGWLEAMLEIFDQKLIPLCGVVMPALMKETSDAREALKLEKVSLSSNFEKYGAGGEFGSLWIAKKDVLDKIREMNRTEIGSNNVFDEINFKCGMGEDRKLWNQIRLAGYETYRTHKTRVFHQGNLTIGKIKDRKQYTEKNRKYLEIWRKQHGIQQKGIKELT